MIVAASLAVVTSTFASVSLICGPALQPLLPQATEAPASAPVPHELEVREIFRSTGDQPAFWAAYSRSSFARVPLPTGLVEFHFDLKEIATVLGSESEAQFMVDSGADRLTIAQDSETQVIRLGTESAITNYVNARTSTIEPWSDRHQQMITPFDDTVLSNIDAGELNLTCSSETLTVDDRSFLLTTYRATNHNFLIGSAEVVMSYRGLAILDPVSGLVYHSVFEQKGVVTNGEKVSEVDHQVVLTLLDAAQGGEIALRLPGRTQERVNSYRFSARTDETPLNPSLETNEVRPEWSVDLWLSGRISEMTMGMIAEQGTNPLPVASLGGLVLSDQAISYGGTQLVEQRKIDQMGEDDPNAPKIDRVQSPLEKAYGPAPFGERLSVLTPETSGVLRIDGREPVVIGALFLLTKDAFGASGSGARFEFATSANASTAATGVPVYAAVAAEASRGAGYALPTALVIGSAGAVIADVGGSGVAGQGGGGGGGTTITTSAALSLNQTFVTGCNVGGFELRVTDGDPGRTWRVDGSGTITTTSTCTTTGNWNESAQGVSVAGQVLVLQIPTPPHGCINGTVNVLVNGTPTAITFLGQPFANGVVSNPCF
ncbi:MAG: hypothetical protein ACJAQ3_000789 [Planctomycetota bacterium]|jgi:hypothetical protein